MGRPAPRMTLLTIDEYLELEERADIRHEYVGGQLYAMSGASKRHNVIVGNLFSELRDAARRTGCRVYVNDVKVRAGSDVIYYPDVTVACGPDRGGPLIEEAPCLVIEVTSPSTELIDRREKLLVYRRVESLLAYVIVEQGSRRVDMHLREKDRSWRLDTVEGSEAIELPCPEVSLSVATIYEGTDVEPPKEAGPRPSGR
jgi:Uma2 family endonuclease